MISTATACVVTPNAGDAELALTFLREGGMQARAFSSLAEVARSLDESTGCLIVVEEALAEEGIPPMREALARLPAWSDLPLVVVSSDVAALSAIIAAAFPTSGNVALLERPLNPHTLVSAVQMALRATSRQREVGELMAQREEAVRLRDEFLAMLAHELRNPLAPMRNALYILRKQEIKDPLVVKSTEILTRQLDHVVHMVDDLMDVARLEHGKVLLKKQRLDLNRVASTAAESCLQAARDRGHRITIHLSPEAVPVDGDVVRLEQIVCNLVGNAVKFSMKAGTIDVTISTEGRFGLVVVEDKGVGFDSAATDRIFAPFGQFNATLDRSAGGLGMGLTIVKRLSELHRGSVRAFSAGVGKGARFEVRIPLAAGKVQEAATGREGSARRRPLRIVVIEDNPDIRETMRMLLDMWGHQVSLAPDGLSGLELVRRQRPDVALIDVGLPGMNGYDLARTIRREIPPDATRLIAVTGYGQPADRDAASVAGFDAHLLKPVDPDMLDRLLGEPGRNSARP